MVKPFFFIAFLSVFTFSIHAQELSVFSGFWEVEYYQDDLRISKKEAKSLLLGYSGSKEFWKRKETNASLFYVSSAVQVGFIFWTFDELNNKPVVQRNIAAPLGLLGSTILGAFFLNSANKNGKKAILAYNKQFDGNTTTFRVVPTSSTNGLGLALRW